MYKLYVFHPGKHLVNAFPLHEQADVSHYDKWIKSYNQANDTQLIRAILGPNELVILRPDEQLKIPGPMFAQPKVRKK